MVSSIIASPTARKPGFETAVTAVIFVYKLKRAVARSRAEPAAPIIYPRVIPSPAARKKSPTSTFRTAVIVLVFAHKLKVAVARSRGKSACPRAIPFRAGARHRPSFAAAVTAVVFARKLAVARCSHGQSVAFAPIPPSCVVRKPGFETAVTAVVFAHKLKVAVARAHGRPAAPFRCSHVISTCMGDTLSYGHTATADGPLGFQAAVVC